MDVKHDCPRAETIAALADGTLHGEEQRAAFSHIARCDDCYELFAEAVHFREEDERRQAAAAGVPVEAAAPNVVAFHRRGWIPAAAAAIVTIGVAAMIGWAAWRARQESSPLEALASASGALSHRAVTGRLSDVSVWKPAPEVTRGGPTAGDPAWLKLQGAAGEILAQPDIAQRPHTRGVAELMIGQEQKAIASLEEQLRRDPNDARSWNDLAAAHLERGLRGQSQHALIRAVAAADRALQLDPTSEAALFNRALALEHAAMRSQARTAWEKYLQVDPKSSWANEARERLRSIAGENDVELWKRERETLEAAAIAGDDATVERLVARFPQQARTWGEGVYLTEWAEQARDGFGGEALRQLAIARAIGEVLRRRSGETMLSESVAAVDETIRGRDRPRLIAAQNGLLHYREGRILYSRRQVEQSEPLLLSARSELHAAQIPMWLLARYFRANVLYDRESIDESEREIAAVRADLKPGYRALTAQVDWQLATVLAHRGQFEASVDSYRAALNRFQSLGEIENEAAMHTRLASALDGMGELDAAWRHRREALMLLYRAGRPFEMMALLSNSIDQPVRRGEWRVAYSLASIAIEATGTHESDDFRAYSFMTRSVAARALGEETLALNDLREAANAAKTIDDPSLRARAQTDLLLTQSMSAAPHDARRAVADLQRCLRLYRESGNGFMLPRVYFELGRAQRSAADVAGARDSFENALNEIERQRSSIRVTESRAAMFEIAADRLLAEAVDLEMESGNASAAFDLIERSRGRTLHELVTGTDTPAARAATRTLLGALAPGTTVLSFYALPKRLVVHVARDGKLDARTIAIDEEQVRRLAGELRDAITSGDERRARGRAVAVYDALLRPVQAALEGARQVVVIPDGATESIPFHALLDSTTGRFAIEKASFLYSPSTAVFLSCARQMPPSGSSDSALVIGNPSFDRARFAALDPLPAAEREAAAVARGRGQLLVRDQPTRSRFLAEAPKASMIYYAGHAVNHPHDPSLSAILLARGTDGGVLSVRDVSSLRLRRAPLVVLSACRSGLRVGEVSDGIRSIAAAFLVAGSPAVVASQWDVDDAATAEILPGWATLVANGNDPAAALQRIQISALHSASPHLRAMRSWASMKIIGGSAAAVRANEKEMKNKWAALR